MLSHLKSIAKAPWIARCSWIFIMFVAVFFANQWGVADEQRHNLFILTIGYAITVIFANRLLTIDKPWAVFLSFVWDLLVWSAFIYTSGGATNPLITLFLMVIAVASVVITTEKIIGLSSLTIGLYLFLWYFYLPLNVSHHDHKVAEKLHLLGMFGVFVFSSIMLTALTIYYKHAMNRSYQALQQAQQAIHGQRRLLAVSSFAANIAHEMSTPIASIQLLTDDIAEQLDSDDELLEDIHLLQSQIAVCRQSLTTLKAHIQHQDYQAVPTNMMTVQLEQLLPKLVTDWRFINPQVQIVYQPLTIPICVTLNAEQLYSILMNIFNNAMQAGATLITMAVTQEKMMATMVITDNGQGISLDVIDNIRQHNTISSAKGWGLGLTLAKTILEYAGGSIDIDRNDSPDQRQGTHVTLTLVVCEYDS